MRTFAVCSLLALVLAGASRADESVVYTLDPAASTFTYGCFDPCLCPLYERAPVRGAFFLQRTGIDGAIEKYDVRDVVWVFARGGGTAIANGSGQYFVDLSLQQQRMVLDLQIDKEPPQRFDSRWQPLLNALPNLDVTVSINGVFCLDTVFEISSRPAAAADVRRYTLGRGTTFQEGCFPPCACPLTPEQPMRGSFTLVQISPNPLFTEYAVLGFSAFVLRPNAPSLAFNGAGWYRVGGEVAVQHQMRLALTDSGGRREIFDSGLVIGGNGFPNIRINMTINNFFCFDRVIRLNAVPLRFRSAGIAG